jgi:hypothetical protein
MAAVAPSTTNRPAGPRQTAYSQGARLPCTPALVAGLKQWIKAPYGHQHQPVALGRAVATVMVGQHGNQHRQREMGVVHAALA